VRVGGQDVSRVAVVTGGGSGMGAAICRHLAARGHKVAVLDINEDSAREVAKDLEAGGASAFGAGTDVSDRTAVFAAMDGVRSTLGPVGITVTSAGIEGFESFLDITPEAWDRMMAVNLSGTFHCVQAVVPDMIEAGWGRIVTISSSSAQSGTRRMAHYVASKGGVIALTKALALDLAPDGITVNTIPPGAIDTPMMRRPIDSGAMDLEQVLARAPLGRLGTPDDIAVACAFLCSEAGGYITGQQINVNGGWYL
jgi:2-hydroxycyclohexanecarboxyl-CoA dehydrogenase